MQARENAQWLRALIVLAKDPISFPAPMSDDSQLDLQLQGADTSLTSLGTYTDTHTYTERNNRNLISLKTNLKGI